MKIGIIIASVVIFGLAVWCGYKAIIYSFMASALKGSTDELALNHLIQFGRLSYLWFCFSVFLVIASTYLAWKAKSIVRGHR